MKYLLALMLFMSGTPAGAESPTTTQKTLAEAVLDDTLGDRGDAASQYALGTMYAEGKGVKQNDEEALKWFRKAADQGFAPAQDSLGFIYANGNGVPQDYVNAHMWWNLAAAHLNSKGERYLAAYNRDFVSAKMTPDQVAEAQKLAREWKPTPTHP